MIFAGLGGLAVLVLGLLVRWLDRRPPRRQVISEGWFAERLRNHRPD